MQSLTVERFAHPSRPYVHPRVREHGENVMIRSERTDHRKSEVTRAALVVRNSLPGARLDADLWRVVCGAINNYRGNESKVSSAEQLRLKRDAMTT